MHTTLVRLAVPASLLMCFSGAAQVAADEFAPVRERLQTCVACHGENGASTDPQFPILAGQEYFYLYTQLRDYASGLRADPVMGPMVQGLSREEMQLIARFFSEQDWPRVQFRTDTETVNRARRAAASGQCTQCHLGTFMGDSRIPRMAGQHYDYLLKTMLDYQTGRRSNDPAMRELMRSFSEEDIQALAALLAGTQ